MSKFNQLFNKIILENNNIQWMNDLIILDKSLSNKLPFIFSEHKNIFQSAQYQKNFNNIWKDLIVEYPSDEANYGQNILNTIFNGQIKQTYSKQQFIKLIPVNWKYYNNIIKCNNFKIYIYKFDFLNSQTENFSLINELIKFYGQQAFKITKQKTITTIDKYLHAQAFKNLTGNSTRLCKTKNYIR